MITPQDFYTDSQRQLQAEQDSEKLAQAVVAAIVAEELNEDHTAFITSRDFFFLSTVNAQGEPTVSYKGGPVGVVQVLDPKTLVFPNYDGNGMFYSMGNAQETGKMGFLFIDMETPNRLRIQGTGRVVKDPDLVAKFPGANMAVVVDIQSVFINCARYIHKHARLEPSKHVPDAAGQQPYPAWKRMDMIQDALPAKDAGKAESEGGLITRDAYEEMVKTGRS